MDEKEILFDLLKSLLALRKSISDKIDKQKESLDDRKEKELIQALKKDYYDFFRWALGLGEDDGIRPDEVAPKWRELHPNLPVPRVALLKEDLQNSFTLFLMDGYPLYLKYKERDAAGLPI